MRSQSWTSELTKLTHISGLPTLCSPIPAIRASHHAPCPQLQKKKKILAGGNSHALTTLLNPITPWACWGGLLSPASIHSAFCNWAVSEFQSHLSPTTLSVDWTYPLCYLIWTKKPLRQVDYPWPWSGPCLMLSSWGGWNSVISI